MDEKLRIEVLQKHNSHIRTISAEIATVLTKLEQAVSKQLSLASGETARLREELAQFQKMFTTETQLFPQRLEAYLQEAEPLTPSS